MGGKAGGGCPRRDESKLGMNRFLSWQNPDGVTVYSQELMPKEGVLVNSFSLPEVVRYIRGRWKDRRKEGWEDGGMD